MCTDMNKKKHLDIDNPAEEMIVILEQEGVCYVVVWLR